MGAVALGRGQGRGSGRLHPWPLALPTSHAPSCYLCARFTFPALRPGLRPPLRIICIQTWAHHLFAVQPWATSLTFLCLGLLIYKMGIIFFNCYRVAVGEGTENILETAVPHCKCN